MGFFAGKIGSKSVFSLDTTRGGSPSNHANPNGNTIFHSDMPFLFIEKRYRVNVNPEGDRGYFVGEMPAELANILSNDQDQVIIPIMVFRNAQGIECRKQLMGRQENVGYNIWQGDITQGLRVTGGQHGSTFPDLNIEWGTWRRGGLNNLEAEIARQGTGGYMARLAEGGDDYSPEINFYCAYGAAAAGPSNIPNWSRVTQRNWNPYSGWNAGGYTNIGRVPMEMHNLVNPNWIGPLGPLGQGHNWVFIRPGGSRVAGWSNTAPGDTWNDWRFTHTQPDFYNPHYNYGNFYCNQFRGDYSHYGDNLQWANGWGPLLPRGFEYTYSITPVAIEFIRLNLRTHGRTGGYYVTNPFQGNEIKISKNEFIIKNYDLRQSDVEMLIAISGGSGDRLGYSNSWFSTNNLLGGMGDLGDGGSFNLCGARATDGVNETYVPLQGGSGAGYPTNVKMGFYKFPRNSSVEISSRDNSIKLNGQDIWSATHRPLHLWNDQTANNVIIGHNYELVECGEGQEILLGEYGVGLNVGNYTNIILMSMEYMAAGLHITGDKQYMVGAGLRWEGCGRRLSDDGYNRGDAFHHMFITLPNDVFVPIHARRTWSFFDARNAGEGKPRANLVYYLRKRGDNGLLQFWVRSWSKVGWINIPKYRINIQKVA